MKRILFFIAGVSAAPAMAQDAGIPGRAAPEFQIDGNINKPTQLKPDPATLKVPEGYRVDAVARDLGNARMLAVAADGSVYVTRRSEADVLMLKDADRNGSYEVRRTVASRPDMHGIALDDTTAYLMTASEIFTAPILADGSLGALTQIVGGLPAAGQHPNRTLAIEGLPGTPQLAHPKAMRQGANQPGFTGWYGPRPPIGDRPHRYHFQVFALDTELSTIPGSTREELLRDMAGHVVARGEIVGTYAQAKKPEKP